MEQGERGEYRPVSRLAVAAAVLGVLSALALVSPLCWALPLVAAGLAVAALADVNRPGAPKVGGLAAVAGLALAIGFGTQAVTDAVATRWLVERRAAAAARHWIDAVRAGRLADAISVCSPRVVPTVVGTPSVPGPPPAVADAAVEQAFGRLAAVQAVAACGPAAAPGGLEVAAGTPEEEGWIVRVALDACGRPGETLRIVVEPTSVARPGGSVERWLVTGFRIER
ncbi:MAG: hypothetical protein ACKONH_13315 [Planctomycetia bacterium]